jgi:NAD(P)-dependent dehydrogenase (short-subunit alcohol dehydrogenase family)
VRTIALDVTDERAACDAVKCALEAFGRLDVLVNNAGYGSRTTRGGCRARSIDILVNGLTGDPIAITGRM